MLKRLASNIPSSANLYLVNVKGEETSFYQKQHRKTTNILFSGIKNVKKKSYVIVEDVISMKKEEEINLRNAVNYTVHHNQSKLFCVSHTITKTGIYSMVGLFNYIIFTGSPSNLPVIRTCLRYFKIENEIVNRWLSCIKKESKKNVGDWDPYYFFDCTKMIFCVARDLLNDEVSNLDLDDVARDVIKDKVDNDLSVDADELAREIVEEKIDNDFNVDVDDLAREIVAEKVDSDLDLDSVVADYLSGKSVTVTLK